MAFFAILPRMNGFRITILTLLCLSVALMFYVVLVVIPGWQGNYNAYQSSLRIAEYEKKNDIHRQQMLTFDPSFEAPEVEQARLDQEEASQRDEQALNEAEESNVVAAARRREEEARAAALKEEADRAAVIGIVASYDEKWGSVMIRPVIHEHFSDGAVLAVQRDRRVVCEVVVDGVDEESGQVSAVVKPLAAETRGSDNADFIPVKGDEIIVSPFQLERSVQSVAPPVPVSSSEPIDAGADESRVPPLMPMPEVPQFTDEPTPDSPSSAQDAAAEQQPAAESATAPEVKRVLDSLPVPQQDTTGSKSSLPSLDAMLHSSLF